MKKKKRRGFYRKVAKAIIEGAPFDVSKNEEGWKKIQELVALYMLRDLCEADRYRNWNAQLEKVEGSFDRAIKDINENPDGLPEFENRHVHKHKPEKKRNNEFLSIRLEYRDALDRNTDRLIRRMETTIRPAIKEIRKTQPGRLQEGQNKARKLLTE